jgi:Protein of unknown function (DUF1549)/Protein of unknown function (DUF1553)
MFFERSQGLTMSDLTMRSIIYLATAPILLSLPAGVSIADDARISVLPAKFTISGRDARQSLIVERMQNGELTGQLTGKIVFQSSNPKVVRVANGVAIPVGNGTADIIATANGRAATAEVSVTGFHKPAAWSFRNHVQSVLTKAGCNSGACHGAAAGKNGFKLSLRGYDPVADFYMITRQSRGRRVVPSDPGRSLLLTKPSGAVPHKGGLRFEVDSPEYRVLSEWIAAGTPAPQKNDPRINRLEILPSVTLQKAGATQQLIVRAHFTDGHSEDVTRWAKFTSTNLSVAKVDDRGKISVVGHGEGAVVAWYLAQNVVATVTVPYPNKVPPSIFAKAKRRNVIDRLVLAKLRRLNLPPSPRCSDGEFLRRAYLDAIGVLPTADEAKAFLADKSPNKRDKVIEQLLKRPEFVDYWTYKWSDLLLLSGKRLRPKALDAFSKWIRQRVEQNTPWDQFVTQIVTASGGTYENGAANFYSLHDDPQDMAETTSMAFLGMSIQCAKCHDHPLEKWTNDQYYGFANMFARVRGKGWGGDYRSGDGHRMIFTVPDGELIQPRTGKPQPPRPLDAEAVPFASTKDRRIAVAKWLTSPKNPYFTRAIVNRVWANFFGIGIVNKVDDLRLTNPATNEPLFAALAAELVRHKYDLKSLMRTILQSETYQWSGRVLPGNKADDRFFSRFFPRRLKAEVLLDAVAKVTGAPTTFKGYPKGIRALQLRDSNVASYFLQTFGRPDRLLTCECERTDQPSMTQVLHILNGGTLNRKLAAKGNAISQLLKAKTPDAEIVDRLYLLALSRYPRAEEKKQILSVLKGVESKQRRTVLEDLYWGVLSSKEFLFQH